MRIRTIAILATAATLMACAATEPVPEQSVEERAQARWDHLIANNAESAWDYHTPGYREMVPKSEFVNDFSRRPIRYVAAEVQKSACDGDRCNVTTQLTYRVPSGPTGIREMRMIRNIEEIWLRLDGSWWYSAQ